MAVAVLFGSLVLGCGLSTTPLYGLIMYNKMNENNLLEFIRDQIEENLNLDYKAADSLGRSDNKKKEIAKDVSAMANSDGGIIIYGLKEYDDLDKKHLPEKIDPINRNEFSKEWLEQIINTNIFPRISNIIIDPVVVNSTPSEVVYVVTIPKSVTAHQASDKKYYRRFNFESVAMFDYEIRDILNRAQTPIMEVEFNIEVETRTIEHSEPLPGISFSKTLKREPEIVTDTDLIVYAYNSGKILANYVNCYLEISEKVMKKNDYSNYKIRVKENKKFVERYCDNTVREVIGHSGSGLYSIPNYGPAHYEPILPKTRTKLRSIELNDVNTFGEEKIYWTIYADNAEPIKGEILFSEITINNISRK